MLHISNAIDSIEDYIYLGVTFNYNGKFNKAKSKRVLLAKKATYSLKANAKQHNLDVDLYLDLFEKLVTPVLLYDSEIWGYECTDQIQIMCNNTMRSFLRCHKTTSVCMINGELGLKEVTEYIENRMLNF